MIHKIP